MLTKLRTLWMTAAASAVLVLGGAAVMDPPRTSPAGQSSGQGGGGGGGGGENGGGKNAGGDDKKDQGKEDRRSDPPKDEGKTQKDEGKGDPTRPNGDPGRIYDRWKLTPPSNPDIPNLPIVVAKSLDGKRVRHTNAMVIATDSGVWLITLLDGLVFETGRRTVDIDLLQCNGGACNVCDTIKDVDSFRFRWVPEAPDHCAIQLREAEIAQLSTCKTWTFVPVQAEPAGGEARGTAPTMTAIPIRAPWADGTVDGRYEASTAISNCNAEELLQPDGFTPIEPAVDVRTGGATFIRESNGQHVLCVGIGDPHGTQGEPIARVLNERGIISLMEPAPPSQQRPVTERLMLERALRRWRNPEGYTTMREFVAENGLDRLVTWRVAPLANGRMATQYAFARDPMDTGRAIAAVSQIGTDALALQISTASNRGQGAERVDQSDAVVAVRKEQLGAAGTPVLSVSTKSPSSAEVLIIETSPSTDAETERLPAVGK
jgi:hypothetical protein